MAFQQVEYSFPDGEDENNVEIEIEDSSAEEVDLDAKSKPEKEVAEVEDDVDIEVVDDTPKADRNRKPAPPPEDVTEDELENYSEKVRSRIKHFSKGYHDERRAKEAALREREELEAYARKLVEENNKLKGTVSKNQAALIEQAKRQATNELENAKRTYKAAYDSGDSDRVLEAQEAMTTARLRVEKLASFKTPTLQDAENDVKPTSETQLRETRSEQPKRTQPEPDSRAIEWADNNPWFGSDDEMTSFALGYHQKLVKQGIDATSDEYYEKINTRMRQVFPDAFEDTMEIDEPEAKPTRKASNVVAPATRSTAAKKIKLTKSQVAIAKRLGVPLELYAKQVADEMRKS